MKNKFQQKILIGIVTIIYVGLLVLFWNIFIADLNFVNSRKFSEKGQLTKALKAINNSIDKNPREPRYFYEKAKILIAYQKVGDAVNLLTKAENLNPNNLVSLKNMVPIYYFASPEKAKIYYRNLKQKYPTDAGVIVLIAKYEKRLRAQQMYSNSIEMLQNLRPDLTEWAL